MCVVCGWIECRIYMNWVFVGRWAGCSYAGERVFRVQVIVPCVCMWMLCSYAGEHLFRQHVNGVFVCRLSVVFAYMWMVVRMHANFVFVYRWYVCVLRRLTCGLSTGERLFSYVGGVVLFVVCRWTSLTLFSYVGGFVFVYMWTCVSYACGFVFVCIWTLCFVGVLNVGMSACELVFRVQVDLFFSHTGWCWLVYRWTLCSHAG